MHAVLLGVVHVVLRADHVTVVSAVIPIREGKCWCLDRPRLTQVVIRGVVIYFVADYIRGTTAHLLADCVVIVDIRCRCVAAIG